MSTSVAYLRKRLHAIGRDDLIAGAENGEFSMHAAAEWAGLITRQPVLGTGSDNEMKRRFWALQKVERAREQAEKPERKSKVRKRPGEQGDNVTLKQADNVSLLQGDNITLKRGQPPDLAAALAEVDEMHRAPERPGLPFFEAEAKKRQGTRTDLKRTSPPIGGNVVYREAVDDAAIAFDTSPRQVHPSIACTTCSSPCAAAAVRELLDVALAARRGATDLAGSVLPRACCKRQLRSVDARALVG